MNAAADQPRNSTQPTKPQGGSAAQVERLLALVPYLQAHPGVRIQKAAEEFQITEKQLRADLQLLWMCGLPGLLPDDLIEIDMDSVAEGGVIHLSNAEYLTRPLRLTQNEVVPLVLGLRTLAEVQHSDAVASALAKLERLSGDETLSDRVHVQVAGGADEVRRILGEAIATGRRLELVYDSASRFETTVRTVDPVSVEVRDGYAYLEAWNLRTRRPDQAADDATAGPDDGSAQGWRTFRIDRIARAVILDEPSQPHGQAPDRDAGWLDQVGDSAEVTLTVKRSSAWIAEYYPVTSVRNVAGGRVAVTLPVVTSAFLRGLLLRLGPDVVAVDPPAAAGGAVRAANEALGQYDNWRPGT